MWYLRTRQGMFWIIPTEDEKGVWLGVNDMPLAKYTSKDDALHDVQEQETGYYQWDVNNKIKPPAGWGEWQEGEPTDWLSH